MEGADGAPFQALQKDVRLRVSHIMHVYASRQQICHMVLGHLAQATSINVTWRLMFAACTTGPGIDAGHTS